MAWNASQVLSKLNQKVRINQTEDNICSLIFIKIILKGQSVRLEYTYDDNLRVLLIRKPDVKIDTDWKIILV
jgi:hypothetical protein